MTMPLRGWGKRNVPPGPYFHGTRWLYASGDMLRTRVVSEREGEEDARIRCFATTDIERAFNWAFQMGYAYGGEVLYVFRVDIEDPEVDTNAEGQYYVEDRTVANVMGPSARVIGLERSQTLADYPRKF